MANENIELPEQAVQHTLAANPMVGVRSQDLVDSARVLLGQMLSHPRVATQQCLSLMGELGRIVTGASELAPDPRDKRFADAAWKESFAYRALAQAYLAWGGALNRFIDEAKMDKRDADRARFVVSLLIDAMSPTNSLAGNPAALKKMVETGGARLLHGLESFVADASCTCWQISPATSPAMAAAPHRSTRESLPCSRISQHRPDRSSTAAR